MDGHELAVLKSESQTCKTLMGFVVFQGNRQSFLGTDKDYQFCTPRNSRVKQVALEKKKMLCQNGYNHGRIFRALGFMY